jgi:hypothetical protein
VDVVTIEKDWNVQQKVTKKTKKTAEPELPMASG